MKTLNWYELPFVGFDCETTSPDPQTARIVQAAIVTHDISGQLQEEDRIIHIDPGVPIPPEASAIHGLTIEKLRELGAFKPEHGISYIYETLMRRSVKRGYPVVVYNSPYDLPLLLAECGRLGFKISDLSGLMILDPLVIDRALDKYRKGSRKLEDTARFYKVELNGAHGAAADARAALGVMRALISRYPALKKETLEKLQVLQVGWYEDWKIHLNQYWDSIGKADRVTGHWPGIVPAMKGAV